MARFPGSATEGSTRGSNGERMTMRHVVGPLTREQRIAFGDLLRHAFVMLRAPGYGYFWTPEMRAKGNLAGTRYALERAVAIGEAFHNISLHMENAEFSWSFHRENIQRYVSRFPEFSRFVEKVDEIERMAAANDPV